MNRLPKVLINTDNYQKNPNCTFEYVFSHKNIDWDYNELMKNIRISSEIISKYPLINWLGGYLVRNPNFNDKIFIDHIDLFTYEDIEYLAKNYLCHNLVRAFPHLNWYSGVMQNKYYRLYDMINEFNKETIYKALDNPQLFLNLKRTEKEIIRYRKDLIEGNTENWNLKKILRNPLVTLEIVDEIYSLCESKNIKVNFKEIVKNDLGKPKYKCILKQFSNNKNSIFKDELIGRTWDPSRFRDWCLTLEENEDLKERW